jgi:hypothetical protein
MAASWRKVSTSFFEKKEAKKLLLWAPVAPRHLGPEQKFFGSFFQKRTAFLLS